MNELLNDKGQVGCALCKEFFTIITSNHLKKAHDISMNEYKLRFPGAPLSGLIFSSKQKFKYSNALKSEPIIEDDCISDDTPEIIELPPIKKIELPIVECNYYGIHEDKVEILKYLKTIFSSIENNYIFDKYSLGGFLEHQTVMDIADKNKRIDFEFPDTFWHNIGFTDKHYREQRLMDSGWKIINFNTLAPTINEVESILRENKLI
jgi:hypothetical protein